MKYCTHCGAQIDDDAFYCPKCGSLCNKRFSPESEQSVPGSIKSRDKDLMTVAYIFCLISTIFWGFLIIPLLWMVPLTASLRHKINNVKPIGVAFKVIIILFVSFIAGIILLIGDSSDEL